MIDLNLVISIKVPDKEAMLDEISDMNSESIMKHYPLVSKVLGEIKTDVIKQLKEE